MQILKFLGLAKQAELDTYRHAYETTKADRDRLLPYESAFNNTATDRNAWKARAEKWENTLSALVQSPQVVELLAARDTIGATPRIRKEREGVYPNVYCVGVPKSATSFLYSCLRQHPKVSVTPKDESRLHPITEDRLAPSYFATWCNEHYRDTPIFAHFDVDFIDVEGGAEAIKSRLMPDAKIIICLRDPVERALSEYLMRLRQFAVGSFREMKPIDFAMANPYNPYVKGSLYTERVKSYIDTFGRENVHVSLREDLSASPTVVLSRLFGFIGLLDPDGLMISLNPPMKYAEISRAPTWIAVEVKDNIVKFKSDVPEQLPEGFVLPSAGLMDQCLRLPALYDAAMKFTADQRRDLFRQYFASDVDALEALIGRKLSAWRR